MRPINKITYTLIALLAACLVASLFIVFNSHDKLYEDNDIQVIETIETEKEETFTEEQVEHTEETKEEDVVDVQTEENKEQLEEAETEPIIEHETNPIVETESIITEPAFYLTDEERRVVECLVMGESGAEPYDGQILVAQCILNACLKDGLQPSQVRRQYGYYGWHNSPSESVKNAVSAVFDNGYKITDELILYFYAPKYSSGSWHETQKFVIQVGGHKFFAEW